MSIPFFRRDAMVVFSLVISCSVGLAAVEKVQPNEKAIAEVTSGKRSLARASWWGFDPADSTSMMQAAIKSGARKLIVENMGAPWVVDKMELASDQQIVFEKGVEVKAKRGAFHAKGDALFTASLKKNITLTGYGAALRMWKEDYDNSKEYSHSEWRHVLSFKSCSNVRVLGLTLADSGGDGIYLGVAKKGVTNTDVLIKDVGCINNYRQGISVISARNLLIENCVLKDTWGSAPMAGIDFEPNDASEELANCVMRNCVSENNRGDAYTFYLRPLKGTSKPISIRIENCRSIGCKRSACFVTDSAGEMSGVKGTMDFINCRFEASQDSAIVVGDKPLSGARVRFVDCQLINCATNQATTPISLSSNAQASEDSGNIHFIDCTVVDSQNRLPMSYHDMSGGAGLVNVTGTLIVKRGDKREVHELTPKVINEWMPHKTFKRVAKFDAKSSRYEPALPGASLNTKSKCVARQRGLSEWLLWAEKGKTASFTVLVRAVGKHPGAAASVCIVSPSGKLTKLHSAEVGKEVAYEFQPSETGTHKIVCDPKHMTATVNSASNRVCIYSESSSIHFLGTTGQYFFWVPQGTKEFALKLSGDNSGERIKATLCDQDGNVVESQDSIAEAHQFIAKPKGSADGEIWSVRLEKPSIGIVEDYHVQLQGIPPVLSHTKESLLRSAK